MLQQIEESTGMTPRALATKPTLATELQFAYSCYTDLAGTRQTAYQGMNPITITEYLAYAELYEIAKFERLFIWEQIHLIDLVWRRVIGKWQDQKAKSQPSGKGTPQKRTA